MDKGYYLYAIGKNEQQKDKSKSALPAKIDGIDPTCSLETIANDGLCAFTSKVDLAEFGKEALSNNLKNIVWLETKARSHDRIVRQLGELATIVPVRFGTVFLKSDGIVDFLRKNASRLNSLLAGLEGSKEMGVVLDFDKVRVMDYLRQVDSSIEQMSRKVDQAKPGTAYLLRKQLDNAKRERLGAFVDSAVNKVAGSLAHARDIKQGPLNARPDDQAHVYVNIACLVPADEIESFANEASELRQYPSESGISVRVTGPWPPYSFSTLEAERSDASKGDAANAS